MLESLGVFVSSEDFAALVSRYDGANSGTVNYEELVRPLFSESVQRGTGIDWVFYALRQWRSGSARRRERRHKPQCQPCKDCKAVSRLLSSALSYQRLLPPGPLVSETRDPRRSHSCHRSPFAPVTSAVLFLLIISTSVVVI